MTAAVEARFHQAMLDIYLDAKREARYNATRFLQMVSERGGLATAHTFLQSDQPTEGFVHLYAEGFKHLTVEALVQRPDFIDLFSDEEIERAVRRVGDLRQPTG